MDGELFSKSVKKQLHESRLLSESERESSSESHSIAGKDSGASSNVKSQKRLASSKAFESKCLSSPMHLTIRWDSSNAAVAGRLKESSLWLRRLEVIVDAVMIYEWRGMIYEWRGRSGFL
jgi:hypothetical protein